MPRPTLITIGLVGAASALVVECAIQATFLGTDNRSALAAGVAMLYVYVFFYATFLDGPTFFYLGEIFPTHLRSQGMTLGMASFCLADIIWLMAAPTAFVQIGWKYYLFFIIITFLGAAWAWFTFPDTRNLPLEQIARLFGDEDRQAPELRGVRGDPAHRIAGDDEETPEQVQQKEREKI